LQVRQQRHFVFSHPPAGDPTALADKRKGPQDFRPRPFGSTGFAMDYKTGAQANASVDHHQFARALRFEYSITVINYDQFAPLSTARISSVVSH
jgi:hypothetical protein